MIWRSYHTKHMLLFINHPTQSCSTHRNGQPIGSRCIIPRTSISILKANLGISLDLLKKGGKFTDLSKNQILCKLQREAEIMRN
jgi:hypothetical protein